MSIETVIARIQRMRAMANPKSPEMRQALTRIGTTLQAQIRQNIIKQRIVDYGSLLNSIKFKIEGNTLSVGSYGIPYARMHEYGGPMSKAQIGAMFINIRRYKGKVQGKGVRGGKGIVTVYADGSGYMRARPYLRPALKSQTQFIIDTIRSIGAPT